MKKIAILGGGLGSMTAAFWLTEKPGWQEEYEITVHQLGWRLGGKGASGRSTKPGYGHRIEEHGLHIWLGFYDNAFATLRRALTALDQLDPPPVSTFTDLDHAFTPQSLVTLEDRYQGQFVPWHLLFPPNLDPPGRETGHTSLWDLFVGALRWLIPWHDDFLGTRPREVHPAGYREARPEGTAGSPADATKHVDTGVVAKLESLQTVVEQSVGAAVEVEKDHVLRWLHALLPHVPALPDPAGSHDIVRHTLEGVRREADTARLAGSLPLELRRFLIGLDLATTVMIGILADGLLLVGFESADGDDFKEWLAKHGAHPETVASSPVEVIYDLVFGFRGGVPGAYDFAAGTCLRGLLRMLFGYRGTLMYKMEAGMGDTIFTPLYGLLRERGVKFRFFERVTALELDPGDGSAIGRIHIQKQATVTPAQEQQGGYWPFIEVNGLDCWPDEPNFEQLVEGDALRSDPDNPGQPYNLESSWSRWPGVGRTVLERGKDFDTVLLGIAVGALPELCGPLLAASERWRAMIAGVLTTPTRSAQLWLDESARSLGWEVPESAQQAEREWEREHGRKLGLSAVVGSYVDPLNTWADMSHLLAQEDWAKQNEPHNISYLVGPLAAPDAWPPYTDHDFPRRALSEMQRQAIDWVGANAAVLLPKGAGRDAPTGLDPAHLIDPEQRRGRDRFDAQFYRVNIDPTERYVLSVKGSTHLRIAGGSSGFSNLVLAGDWTYNRVLNAGCVEATVASGMEASRAICGVPEHIVGDDDTARPMPGGGS